MARPKSFDTEKVLDTAVDCFWRDGMNAASTRELAQQMGIAGPSLYNAFGCKRDLFAKALERYAECRMRVSMAEVDAGFPPKAAIAAFIERALERAIQKTPPANCLIIKTAMELPSDDTALQAQIGGYFDEIRAFFMKKLNEAREAGDIPGDTDTKIAAQMLLSLQLGICVMARSGQDRTSLEDAVRPALAGLGIDFPPNQTDKTQKGMT